MIFQGFNLLSQRTALKNVCYPLEIAERDRLQAEYDELQREIARLTAILADERLLMEVIKSELHKIYTLCADRISIAGSAVTGYGESAINYTLRVWCNNADYWDVYFQVNQRVKNIFDEQGITMTYPHLNVHLDK